MTTTASTFTSRLARIAPYFAHTRLAFSLVILGALVVALTEPVIPALMKPLLDSGFQAGRLPLWAVPAAVIGLFAIRGVPRLRREISVIASSVMGVLRMPADRFIMFASISCV